MQKYFKHIIVLIFMAFSFLFAHSELEVIHCQEEAHHFHDFCKIVDEATLKKSNDNCICQFKFETEPSLLRDALDLQTNESVFKLINYSFLNKQEKRQQKLPIYLSDRILLI